MIEYRLTSCGFSVLLFLFCLFVLFLRLFFLLIFYGEKVEMKNRWRSKGEYKKYGGLISLFAFSEVDKAVSITTPSDPSRQY